MSKKSDNERPVYVFDFETDPFEYGQLPEPFCVGIMGEGTYQSYWGNDCVSWILDRISELPTNAVLFAHNGGKFDFIYLKDEFRGSMLIINGRIVKCTVRGIELRDSYAMIPVPLKAYDKDEIDYKKMHRKVRDDNRDEILRYLRKDCDSLYRLVNGYIAEFGMQITMASAAIKQLIKFHTYERLGENADAAFRNYYYGGRVECFEKGILTGDFKIYDINSSYPNVMRNYLHPVSKEYSIRMGNSALDKIEECDFAKITATSDGALPWRDEKGRLTFPKRRGDFYATGHEIRAGLETGTLKIQSVKHSFTFNKRVSFSDFIDHFWQSRLKAKADGNKLLDIFYKLVMNSSYGKFAQNPSDFKDWIAADNEALLDPWICENVYENGLAIYWRPSERPQAASRHNVATAASITGAARAELLRGLAAAERPVYCDTDSIICERLHTRIDDKELGAWKFEKSGNRLGIAGKKLYALYHDSEAVKAASKGAQITPREIMTVAAGGEVISYNQAPTFSLNKKGYFISRTIRRT